MTGGRPAGRADAPAPPGEERAGWCTAVATIDLERPVLMGVLNVTPDSFSDGGRFLDPRAALARAERLRDEGADLIDIGGESTRPGAEPVPVEEELARVLDVIEAVARQVDLPVSVDTTKLEVARRALDAGAAIINDISGLRFEPRLADLAAGSGAGLVLMHIRGEPRTMQQEIRYDDLLKEIRSELRAAVERALAAGCAREQLVVDPGIGFGKTAEHNLSLLNRLDELTGLGPPVLVGPSRKSFIGAVLDLPVDQRVEGTLAACVLALARGARIFRVHDVRPARRALDLARAILES